MAAVAVLVLALCAALGALAAPGHPLEPGQVQPLLKLKDVAGAGVRVSTLAARPGKNRVMDSNQARKGQFPYQAGIVLDGKGFCSGAIVASRWILTAGHCIENTIKWVVSVGTNDFHLLRERHRQVFETLKAYVPPEYHFPESDIGLIELPQDMTLNNYVSTVVLAPKPAMSFTGRIATLSAYGPAESESDDGRLLRYTRSLKVVDYMTCGEKYGLDFDPSTACLSRTKGTGASGVCGSDSGSPVTVYDNFSKEERLYGLVSFVGSENCSSHLPIGITAVSYNSGWVDSLVLNRA